MSEPGTYEVKITREPLSWMVLLGGRYWWEVETWRGGTVWHGGFFGHLASGFAFTDRGAERRARRAARRHAKPKQIPEPKVRTFTIGEQA